MSRRLLDYAPEHGRPGTVHFVNPDDPHDYIEVTPLANGGLEIRSNGLGRALNITPRVSNEIRVRADKW